jgi:diguanylate cyclase (GGDEF)-like protein
MPPRQARGQPRHDIFALDLAASFDTLRHDLPLVVARHGPEAVFFRPGLAGPASPVILGRMSFAERSLRVQYQIARALAESASLHDAAPLVLRAICETLDWELGLLWRVDPSADELRFVDLWRAPSVHVERFEQVSRDRSFARDVGLPGRVWASGKPAWIPDVVQDTNFPRATLAAECGLHAGFAFPIRLGDETLGVFEFFAQVIRPPEEILLTLMEGIGNQIGQFDERRRAEAALAVKVGELAEVNARLARQHEELERAHAQLREAHAAVQAVNGQLAALAVTDSLTGVANHRALQHRLDVLVADAGRGRTFSLVLCDLDEFKHINDTYGHEAGNAILIAVARSLAGRVRKGDLVARYGGDEFVILLADANAETAVQLTDRGLRQRLETIRTPSGAPLLVSFGVSTSGPEHPTGAALLRAADEALYEAKRIGRNRIVHRAGMKAT